jgi:hypothetical protein
MGCNRNIFKNGETSTDVVVGDQTTPPIDLYFIKALGAPTNPTAAVAIDDRTITLDSTTNFVDGTYVGVVCNLTGRFYFGTQLGAPSGSTITVDTPFDFAYDTNCNVLPLTRELNVNGATTVQEFEIQGPGTEGLEVDVTRIMIQMETDTVPQLSEFGDITALTNGIVLRKKDGEYRNIWNVKKNSEFANLAFDFNTFIGTNPGAGINGFSTRYTFAGQSKHGVAVRLKRNESLQILVQDNLTSILSFRVIAEGHIVQL